MPWVSTPRFDLAKLTRRCGSVRDRGYPSGRSSSPTCNLHRRAVEPLDGNPLRSQRAEVLGRSLSSCIPTSASAEIKEYYAGRARRPGDDPVARAAPLSSWRCRRRLPTSAFGEMPQSGRIGPLIDAGVIVGTVTIIEDVSDRHRQRERAAEADRGAATGSRDGRGRASREGRIPLDAVA